MSKLWDNIWKYFWREDNEKTPPSRRRSIEELFILGPNKIDIKKTARRQTPINKAPEENIYDSLGFVIYCPKHEKIAVSFTEHTGSQNGSFAVWLPFIYLSPKICWEDAINAGVSLVLSDGKTDYFEGLKAELPWNFVILDITRVQLPHSLRFVTRVIALVRLQKNRSILKCCRNTTRISWVSKNQLYKGIDNCWGLEVNLYVQKTNVNMADMDSYQTESVIDLEYVLKYVERYPTRYMEEVMLNEIKINEKQVESVFLDFLSHCFPSVSMSYPSFKSYLKKFGFIFDENQMSRHFNAFNFPSDGYLDFHELLLGMACIEPNTYSSETRTKYIFRYYDVDKDGILSESEFQTMVKDMNPNVSDRVIAEKVSEGMNRMKATAKGISFEKFFYCVGSHRFRGTSALCRAPKPLFSFITRSLTAKGVKANPELKKITTEYLTEKTYQRICKSCRKTKYELCANSVMIGINGNATDFELLTEIENMLKKQSTPQQKYTFTSEKYLKDISMNKKSVPHFLRDEIQRFNERKGTRDKPNGLFADSDENRKMMANIISQIAKEVIPIFESEDRCIKIISPAVVIGDIHGNLEDLFSIEKCLFKSAPIVSSRYVFLGDIVDRGKWSVECALYVISLKLMSPTNFYLLRGNHETRFIQQKYTFEKECKHKYRTYGDLVFETLNKIFDRLPLAAVIDDSIFCCHGGVPASAHSINDINKIKLNLQDPEDSPVAWELLWNDPVDYNEFIQTINLLQKMEDISRGFVNNLRRATAYFFNEFATQEFLKINGLSHVVRAHEVPLCGFRLQHNYRCLTIFSSSHYCGAPNKAVVLQISDQNMIIIELDTTNNKPATDDPKLKY